MSNGLKDTKYESCGQKSDFDFGPYMDLSNLINSLRPRLFGKIEDLGIVRNKDSIIRGLNDVIKIERESKGLSAKLNDMILVSKFIIIGAYLRRESRGCHLRSDYQDTDKDFIKHFDIKYSEIDDYIKTILDSTISEVDEKLVS